MWHSRNTLRRRAIMRLHLNIITRRHRVTMLLRSLCLSALVRDTALAIAATIAATAHIAGITAVTAARIIVATTVTKRFGEAGFAKSAKTMKSDAVLRGGVFFVSVSSVSGRSRTLTTPLGVWNPRSCRSYIPCVDINNLFEEIMFNRRNALAAFASVAVAATTSVPASAAPASVLIDNHWTQFGATPAVDHSSWNGFLASYVSRGADGVNRVNYAAAKAAQGTLKSYIAALAATDPTTLTRDAAMAYWINLYNAKTVDVILDNYPVQSIRDIGGGFFSRGPWDEKVVTVSGRALSLNDIEHGILRPIWRDARIHYAVNCASIGCPNLRTTAFTAATLGSDLDQAARDYVSHPRGAEMTANGLVVSSIFEWYKADFGGTDAGVIAHLAQYGGPSGASSIYDDRYDWSLNE